MPKKQTVTEQVVWLLLQMTAAHKELAAAHKELEKIKQALQEHILQEHTVKRSCNADAFARSNDVCRTPPAKRIGGVPRTRSQRPSPTTPPTPPTRHRPVSLPSPPSTGAALDAVLETLNSPQTPLSPLTSFTIDEILKCLSPSFDLERELKLLEERAKRSKRA